jgi:hypothetical protein
MTPLRATMYQKMVQTYFLNVEVTPRVPFMKHWDDMAIPLDRIPAKQMFGIPEIWVTITRVGLK